MKVFIYSGMQKMIEKSGVGRAIYHQKNAAGQNGIEVVDTLKEADVVHINTIFPKSAWVARRAKRKHIPVIYHAHSTKEDFRNSFIGSNLFDNLFGHWIKHCYNLGDIIVTPTNYSKSLLQAYGITKRIEVISNGIDIHYYDKNQIDRETFRKKYGFKADDIVIMSVGLTIKRKGIEDFVELARRMPQYFFIWFGEVNMNTIPREIRKVVQTKLPNLIFAGYAKKDDLREAYGSCDLFLFPSYEETEGIVVLEAAAMKIPALLRDIPVYADWLTEDRDVYKARSIDEFEQKITQIVENKCVSLTENAYQVAKERDLQCVGKQLGQVYRDAQVQEGKSL